MNFRFAPILRRLAEPYALITEGEGTWDNSGVYQPPEIIRKPHTGVIQPLGVKLLQLEGGRYSSDDRLLYTTAIHNEGDTVEYKGTRYTVDIPETREYVDVQKYTLKRVSTHDTIPSNTGNNGAGTGGTP